MAQNFLPLLQNIIFGLEVPHYIAKYLTQIAYLQFFILVTAPYKIEGMKKKNMKHKAYLIFFYEYKIQKDSIDHVDCFTKVVLVTKYDLIIKAPMSFQNGAYLSRGRRGVNHMKDYMHCINFPLLDFCPIGFFL